MGVPSAAASRRPRTLLAPVLAGALALALTAQAAAAPTADDLNAKKRKVDQNLSQAKDDLDETSSQLAGAQAALKATQAKIPAAQAALSQAQSAQAAAEQAAAQATQDLEVAQAAEAKAEADLNRTGREIDEGRVKVARLAAQLYQDDGMGSIGVALDSRSPQELASRLAMAETVLDVQGATLDRLAAARAAQTAAEDYLSALRGERQAAKKRADDALGAAVAATARTTAAKQTLDELAATQSAQTKDLAAQVTQEKARIAVMEAEQADLAKQLKALAEKHRREIEAQRKKQKQGVSGGSTTGGGYLSSPLPGFSPGSAFGMRFHPILHYWRLHAGNDWGAPCGTPLHAAADGEVILRHWSNGGYGNRVWIDHGVVKGVNLVTTYNHMSTITIGSGRVKRGQVIGTVGTTGLSTGCHLHFETHENGVPVNPEKWL